ncbi:lysozyme inhibitor LprI family protein [Pseudomonas nitroreducens]|uniref:lysozyme inhibitor LprI family protein n=1 Tax=Pseudomonas nitroreducens TaxID=46680 RepID=UPI003AF25324
MWKLAVLGLAVVISQSALALESKDGNGDCNNLSISQQVFECSRDRVEAADAELNRVYKGLIRKIHVDYSSNIRMGEELEGRLRASQRAWLVSRDANCLLEVFFVEKEKIAFEVTRNNCVYRESSQRIEYLKIFNDGL